MGRDPLRTGTKNYTAKHEGKAIVVVKPRTQNMLQTTLFQVVFNRTNSKLQELKDTDYNVKEGAKGLPFASFQH